MYDAGADAARWKVNGTSTTTATAPGNLTSVQVSDAQSGGYVMRAVAGFSGGWRPDILIPFDPNVLYRISFTIRQTVASSNTANQRCYAGVVGVAADGTTLVNVSGAASVASQHYVAVAAQNLTAGGGWQRFTGYLKGYAGAGVNGTQVASPTPTAPSVLHANARYISPLFYANYTGGDGTAEIGMFTIEVVETGAVQTVNIQDGAITTPKMVAGSIQGDRITAGTLNADRIVGSSITTAQLGALSVTAAQLAANSVTATAISAGAVTATAISAGSIDATHIKAGAITADRLAITGGSNMLPDPSFEGAGGAALVAGQSFWSIANTGNGSLKSAQVNAVNATAVIRTLTVATFPVLPGQAFRIATDVNPSTDWNGTSVRFYARWIDSAGGVTFGFVTNTTPTKGSWTNLAGTVTAPVGTVTAEFRLASYDATAGTVSFDNASIQPVMSDVLIADGAITANKLDAAAINGKTITGAIVQTAATGSRIVLDASKFSAYGGATATQKIVIQPDYLPLFASTPSPRIYLTSDDGTNEAYLQVNGSGDAASLYTYSGDFVDTADSNTYRWRTYMGKDTWVTERARIVTPFGAIVPDTPRISMTKIQATITAPDTYVVGTFHASSIVTGRVSITPSAANVPTSLTVTGLNINGSSPRFVATASTQVPGTSVLGVGCSDVSTSSVTIWLTRTNTTATSIDYIGMAS
jgi:hypothetical protein